ncbi:type II secretion system F family protein [Microbacterium sp. P05]|uniref:type II secretion system F family protein n=1 Tax=Microbacterium sp. P05 TaxID=3366948 RepID=UPI003745570A
MLTESAFAVVIGCAFGLGVCLLLSLAPRVSAPSLSRRIAPYIRDVIDPQGLGPVLSPVSGMRDVAREVLTAAARLFGGADALQRRLDRAGWGRDAAAFRSRQLLWGLAGLAAGGLVLVALAVVGAFTPVAALLPPIAAVAAAVLFDARLSAAARARARRVEEELPTVLDFLALCLAAGEGILDSLRRVGELGSGELTGEIRTVVLAVGTGSPLPDALTAMSRRVQIPAVSRSVDQVVAALDRGAPLALVLQAQASDAREDAKRTLIEQAGRKEILMLLPLVFLILPLSVLFAVFPGVFLLRLGIG